MWMLLNMQAKPQPNDIKKKSEKEIFVGQIERRMEGQGEWNIPPTLG